GSDGNVRLWAVGQNEPIETFRHEKWAKGAAFSRDESRILTWGGNPLQGEGSARLWSISLDESISPDERILDYRVRSATTLQGSVDIRTLTFNAWMAEKRALEAIRAKRQSMK